MDRLTTLNYAAAFDRLIAAPETAPNGRLADTTLPNFFSKTSATVQIHDYQNRFHCKWDDDYIRLARLPEELIGLNLKKTDHQKFARLIWEAIPDCKFKRFQECFCPGERFVLPREALQYLHLDNDGRLSFGNFNWGLLSVDGTLPRADLLQDEFVKKAALATFPPETLNQNTLEAKRKRFEVKNSLEVFNLIKKVWNEATPISSGLRWLQINTMTLKDLRGSMISIRDSGGGFKRPKVGPTHYRNFAVTLFTDAYAAFRSFSHRNIQRSHEDKILARLISTIARQTTNLITLWTASSSPAVKQKLVELNVELADNTATALGKAKGSQKRYVADVIEQSRNVTAGDRPNPRATAERLRRAGSVLGVRERSTKRMAKHEGEDSSAIKRIILSSQAALESVGQDIPVQIKAIKNYFELARQPAEHGEAEALLQIQLYLTPAGASQILMRPFGDLFANLESSNNALLTAIQNNDQDAAFDAFNERMLFIKGVTAVIELNRATWVEEFLGSRELAIDRLRKLEVTVSQPYPFETSESVLDRTAELLKQIAQFKSALELPNLDRDVGQVTLSSEANV